MKIIAQSILIFIILAGCKENDTRTSFYNNEGLLVKRRFYSDSVTVHTERTFLNDTTLHGYAKGFFEDGSLDSFVEFEKGAMHGRAVFYFRNGSVRIKGQNLKGKRDGVWLWYDSVGNILTKGRFDLGVQCGETIEYGSKKHVRECYCFTPDENGVYQYNAKYDSLGNKTFEQGEGSPILIFESTTFPSYKIGDTLIVRTFLCPCAIKSEATATLSDLTTGAELDKIVIKAGQDYYRYNYKLKATGELQFKVEQSDIKVEQNIQVE